MCRRLVIGGLVLAVALTAGRSVAAADGPYELQVTRGRWLRDSPGTLTFTDDGVTFRTSGGEARTWTYANVRQIQILDETRLALLTYQESGLLTFRRDERLEFAITKGQIPPELVAHLFDRAGKTVVTAVVPPGPCCSQGDVAVALRRAGVDAQGTLSFYETALVFRGERTRETRVWRFDDVLSVLRIDPARLEVVALEGGGGDTRRFQFELKEPLPKGFYEQIWERVNAPEPATLAQTSTGGAQ